MLTTSELPNECEYLPLTNNGIKQQIKRLKNQISPGEDGIQGEIIKRLDKGRVSRICNVIERIWQEENSRRNGILR